MAGWGGKRSGSGRKRSWARTTEIGKRVARMALESNGEYQAPLDFLITVMQDATQPLEMRVDCAKAAAPYVHAKLQSIDITSEEDRRMVIEFVDFRAAPSTTAQVISQSSYVKAV